MISVTKEGVLLEPTKHKFENGGVLNPATIEANGEIHMLYRAANHANYSSIGHCTLSSPTIIKYRDEMPLIYPMETYESHGVEDPRVVQIDGTFYLTYTAYDGKNALGALMVSEDLKSFERKGIITPKINFKEYKSCIESCDGLNDKYLRFIKMFDEHTGAEKRNKFFIWDKDVMFFPRKINGKFAFLHRIFPDIQIVYFDDLADLSYQFWKDYLVNIKEHIVLSGKLPFEASYIGGGCPPIETADGWLLIYHGVEDTKAGYVYHACAALMNLDAPTKEIGRLSYPLFSPTQDWEKYGVIKNVVFPTGTLIKDDTLYIHYGAADKRIGTASVSLSALLTELKTAKQ